MEKTQEQVKTNQENIEAPASGQKQEEVKKSMSISDIWANTAKSYWDMMIWKQPETVSESPFIPKIFKNGHATRTRNAWNMSVNMCKSLSLAMIDPNMLESLFKVTEDMPETLLKMQRKELDRIFKWNSEVIGKTENVEKLMNLMLIRNFK